MLGSTPDPEWIFWRPVQRNLARGLIEVRKEWSLLDLVRAHEVLNIEADAEEIMRPQDH